MEPLELPATEYAYTMAGALAFMYWHAKVDANDAEFVLAPTGSHIEAGSWHLETLGDHTMWLLDFDCVNPISMDEYGIAQATAAFFRNDPYFPRPFGETELDNHLWSIFVQRFLGSSGHILSDSPLPQMMIDALEATGKDRKRNSGAFT